MTPARALADWAGARPGGAVLLLSADDRLRRGIAEATGAEPVVGNAADLPPVPDASVDLVWLDLPAPGAGREVCLTECARVTRRGGRVVVRAVDPPDRTPDEAADGLGDALTLLGLGDVSVRVTLAQAEPDTAGDIAVVARILRRGVPSARLLAVVTAAVARGTVGA